MVKVCKRKVFLLSISFWLIALYAYSYPYIEKRNNIYINWSELYIEFRTEKFFDKIIRLKKFSTIANFFYLTDEYSILDFIKEFRDFRPIWMDFLSSLEYYKNIYTRKGIWISYRLYIKGSVLLKYFAERSSNSYIPVSSPLPVCTIYSGLVVDTTGFGVKPVLFPEFYDDKGKLVLNWEKISPKELFSKGFVVYIKSLEEVGKIRKRVGNRPMFIRARYVYGKRRSKIVLPFQEFRKYTSCEENIENLKKGRIAVIID